MKTREEKLATQRAYSAKWREKHRERLRIYFREYYAAHTEAIHAIYERNKEKYLHKQKVQRQTPEAKVKKKAYNKANRARDRATRRAWVAKNPEREREIKRRERERNAASKRLSDREYRRLNRVAWKASLARSKAKKPDLYRGHAIQSAEARRARLLGNPVERVSIQRLVQRDRSLCHLCGQLTELSNRSIDHLIPVSRGGAHAEWNLMIAHLRCNQRRGTKRLLPDETKEAALAYIAARSET